MATQFLSTANSFLSSTLPSSSSSSSSSSSLSNPTLIHIHKHNSKRQQQAICKAFTQSPTPTPLPSITKRNLSISFITGFVFSSLAGGGNGKGCFDANAAILEAEDDEELLEKVKKDRKKRLEKQSALSSSMKEKGQDTSILCLLLLGCLNFCIIWTCLHFNVLHFCLKFTVLFVFCWKLGIQIIYLIVNRQNQRIHEFIFLMMRFLKCGVKDVVS